jgi:anti-anti-sigma factor
MTETLSIHALVAGHTTLVLTVYGELDLATSPQLLEAALKGLSISDVRDVVVDLSGVSFLDASGLTAMARACRALRDGGRGFKVRGATGIVAEILHLSGLAEVFGLPLSPPPAAYAGRARSGGDHGQDPHDGSRRYPRP